MDSVMKSDIGGSWPRRIIRFPLTRIIIALGMVAAGTIVRDVIVKLCLPVFALTGEIEKSLLSTLLTVPIVYFSYVLYVRYFEKRPAIELAGPGGLKDLGGGVLLGMGLFIATIGSIWSLGYYKVTGFNEWTVMIPAFSAAVIAGFMEEILVRGIVFRIMEEGLGTWLSLGISASLFGFLHLKNPNATILSGVAIALTAGILLASAYILTRRLWLAIGLHFAWNFTQGGIFGVAVSGTNSKGLLDAQLTGPDLLSGGPFGAEDSIFVVIFALLLSAYLLHQGYKRHHMIRPFRRGNPVA
jgi:membrane protease YdiL (CAAX protease family)